MDLNKVMLIGRVTKDPDLRTTQQGANVVNFGLATNKKIKGEEKVEFHNIVAWNKLADIVAQYCRAGSKLYIEGELTTRSWDDQSGIKKYKTEILAFNIIMLDNKSSDKPYKYQPQNNQQSLQDIGSHDEISIEDIPF